VGPAAAAAAAADRGQQGRAARAAPAGTVEDGRLGRVGGGRAVAERLWADQEVGDGVGTTRWRWEPPEPGLVVEEEEAWRASFSVVLTYGLYQFGLLRFLC